jgi:general secretion pathway protein F
MPAFEYTAIDAHSREQRGVLEGDSPRQVRQQLRDRGWLPTEVKALTGQPQTGQPQTGKSAPRSSRTTESQAASASLLSRRIEWRSPVSTQDLALLTRQLATLVRAALPLDEALQAVAEQSEKPAVQRVLRAVRARVVEGETLAAALADYPKIFAPIYRATVAAGEQAGKLDVVLERLADYTESRDVMRQRVLGALLYPMVLTAMSLVIVAGLLTYVVPQVVEVFEAGNNTLPWLTRALLGLSDGLRNYGFVLLAVLLLAALLAGRALKVPANRLRFDAGLLRAPLIGRILRGLETARFTRTFSILTGSAVPVLDGLHIAAGVIANRPMRQAVEHAAERVREGAPIGRALGASKLFPPMMVHLIGSGESSGRLEEMLDRAAANQERELDSILTALVGLLGPLLIILMGVFVLLIVFAMLLPIFEMNTLIR